MRVRVRLTPKARSSGIDGVAFDSAGKGWLKVKVTAAPEHGRANAALVALLAREWRLPKRAFALVAGARDRSKTIEVAGDADALLPSIEDWARRRGA